MSVVPSGCLLTLLKFSSRIAIWSWDRFILSIALEPIFQSPPARQWFRRVLASVLIWSSDVRAEDAEMKQRVLTARRESVSSVGVWVCERWVYNCQQSRALPWTREAEKYKCYTRGVKHEAHGLEPAYRPTEWALQHVNTRKNKKLFQNIVQTTQFWIITLPWPK